MNKLTFLFVVLFTALQAAAQKTPLWLRYPAISPDGKNIVFSFKGDLYKVSSAGGTAYPLTLHEAHDFMPVWSHDGKKIAFASDRFGNFDVFVIDAEAVSQQDLLIIPQPIILTIFHLITVKLFLAPAEMIFLLPRDFLSILCLENCMKFL